jgi:HJR/Mrr/RecB family endonuclease
MKTSIPPVLITFALVGFALVQNTHAVTPAPDGGYPGGNTAEGQNALLSLTTGTNNTAVGYLSLRSDTGGGSNTAVGAGALSTNTGAGNTATGAAALFKNTTGGDNTATGLVALYNTSTGNYNTANGAFALLSNTTGSTNTASGFQALFQNTTGSLNTANGYWALFNNIEGFRNTANGVLALFSNSTGTFNTAVGGAALINNTFGNFNTAIGDLALVSNTTGNRNLALGQTAGQFVVTADDVICIGAAGADVSATTWIGGVYGVTTQSGTTAPVVVSDGGQLGTVASSKRFKKDIATMDKASEAIMSLRPVTFHYKTDAKDTPQFGLIAEEVAKVNPALVLPDKEGKPYTVRYDAVNAMLLNEFLKEHRKVEAQEATITQLKKDFGATVAQLTARLNEQAAQIQKVSAQLEASKATPQVVNNP